jgi:hypothetical protein
LTYRAFPGGADVTAHFFSNHDICRLGNIS